MFLFIDIFFTSGVRELSKTIKKPITMSQNKAKSNAKREAYAKKQEAEGNKVIMWIIGILIALGVVFAGFSCLV